MITLRLEQDFEGHAIVNPDGKIEFIAITESRCISYLVNSCSNWRDYKMVKIEVIHTY